MTDQLDDSPYDVEMRIVRNGTDSYVEHIGLTMRPGGRSITSEGLREIPVMRLMRKELGEMQAELEESMDVPKELKRGPIDLRAVSDAYRLEMMLGKSPTVFVAERFGIPRSTVGKWIMKARNQGFLGAAVSGPKGGES